jgi:hypothetical protein
LLTTVLKPAAAIRKTKIGDQELRVSLKVGKPHSIHGSISFDTSGQAYHERKNG